MQLVEADDALMQQLLPRTSPPPLNGNVEAF
jgi:hypothetical protein